MIATKGRLLTPLPRSDGVGVVPKKGGHRTADFPAAPHALAPGTPCPYFTPVCPAGTTKRQYAAHLLRAVVARTRRRCAPIIFTACMPCAAGLGRKRGVYALPEARELIVLVERIVRKVGDRDPFDAVRCLAYSLR